MAHDKEIKTKKTGYRFFFSPRLAIVRFQFQIWTKIRITLDCLIPCIVYLSFSFFLNFRFEKYANLRACFD